ncbi:MAG: RnfABCDGE type electron transport complex subunit D [Candidatus Omnitrophica bacterium]|nr:RnfABCDGE type electron transport complex subunit D [Candidatus Omnitrophota bacterium]
MKLKKTFSPAAPPHWRAHHSSEMRFWLFSLALLPLLVVNLIFHFTEMLRLIFFSIASGFFFDYVSFLLGFQRFRFDTHTLLTSFLFSFLIPFGTPFWAIVAAVFLAVFVAKNCFGGWGNFIFQPVFLARASLFIFLPESVESFREFEAISNSFFHGFFEPHTVIAANVSALAVLLGGIFLIERRLVSWKVPCFFLLSLCGLSYVMGQNVAGIVLRGEILIAAFFIVTDAASPIHSFGKILSSIGTAVLIVFMNHSLTTVEAVTYGVLMMNGVTPLIDRYLPNRFVWVKK